MDLFAISFYNKMSDNFLFKFQKNKEVNTFEH